jgi:hypothetical protein
MKSCFVEDVVTLYGRAASWTSALGSRPMSFDSVFEYAALRTRNNPVSLVNGD